VAAIDHKRSCVWMCTKNWKSILGQGHCSVASVAFEKRVVVH
jgi:hypothetical protein